MGPKSPKSKKKLTKAEKEALKREEEERRIREEEETRIREEQEEKERKVREKKEAEERRRLENEERKRRKGQLQELDALLEGHRSGFSRNQAAKRDRQKWNRYMRCDGSPDPTVAGEINTYINLCREDNRNNDIESILKSSQLMLDLIEELGCVLVEEPSKDLTEAMIRQYKGTTEALQDLLHEKLDLASQDLLRKATELADSETANLQKVYKNEFITLCAWGNLSKNPRIKSFEFEERGFSFELPKVLTLSDCAFRILFTKFDHYSQYCKSFESKVKVPPVVEVPEEEPKKEEATAEGEKAEGETAEGEGPKEGEEGEGGEGAENKPELETEKTEDVMAALSKLEGDEEEEEKKEEEKEEEEPMEEDYEIATPEPIEYEEFDAEEEAVDLRANQIMGGVLHFDLLLLPPQPKTAREWTLTKVTPSRVDRLEYTPDSANPEVQAALGLSPSQHHVDKENVEKKDEKPPIKVSMKLPSDVYFCEEPQIARWMKEKKQWELDGFTENSFNEETRTLSFKTRHFGVIGLFQDAHINMPFQSWEIRPKGKNHVLITIIAAIVEVEIEVKEGGLCCLLIQEDKPELLHMKDRWLPLKDFIRAMKTAGLNLFPDPDSHKYVSIQTKNPMVETRLYAQMALTSSTMAYAWSKWNSEVKDDTKLIFQGSEQLQDEPLLEEDWSLFMVTKKRTTKLKMTEFTDTFSDDYAEGTEFHADMYHMAMDIASAEGRDRISGQSYEFTDSVYHLLKGCKLLTYA